MNSKKKPVLLLVITILLILVGYYLTSPESFGLCSANELGYCTTPYNRSLGQPLVLGLSSLVPVLLILMFLRQEAFTAWKKFAIWAIPAGAILIALTPVQSGGGGIGLPSIDREIATWIVSIVFLVVSFVIILRKQLAGQK